MKTYKGKCVIVHEVELRVSAANKQAAIDEIKNMVFGGGGRYGGGGDISYSVDIKKGKAGNIILEASK